MDSEYSIHIRLRVPVPIEDSVVSDITEHLQKVHSDTTLTSITHSEGYLFFKCPISDWSIQQKFGHLFTEWLDTQTVPLNSYAIHSE
ncbi:hypothetical protein BJX63DRAFT_406192 [Aspergillus granulosus]|uniref:Uncharacterized protein n=1 Tax=Aspergillus granulosus TaxID=176169 RepID=A0ABR4H1S8_9EURO